jgi:two-component system OmpR family response regulator
MATLARIMMVEDEPDIQAIAKIALETVGGLAVEICSSGREALEKAPLYKPELILMDVMMPGMDGPSTLKELRARPDTKSIPVIFMTAKVQPQEVANFKMIGALGVIAKPFDPMTLASTVRSIWEKDHAPAR